jgi:hypothetical protein
MPGQIHYDVVAQPILRPVYYCSIGGETSKILIQLTSMHLVRQ